jgi:hypothetical protein
MIEQLRYNQAQQQGRSWQSLIPQQSMIATYFGRDPITGQRVVELADGSRVNCNYLSMSEPAKIPQYQPARSIGIPGQINNR